MENINEVREIYADLIIDPKEAMRSNLDRDLLWELADDIKKNGLINPITVRPVHVGPAPEGGCTARDDQPCTCPNNLRYEVVAGHRRFTACKMASVIKIPCVVRVLTDAEVFAIKTSENLVRQDVDPVDEGKHFLTAMKTLGKSADEIAETVNRGRQYVLDRIAVAEMPEYMHDALRSGQLKLGVALKLVQIEPDEKRKLWVALAIQDGITVRTAESWLYQHVAGTLPDAQGLSSSQGIADDVPYQPPQFECAVDGKKYAATDCTFLPIYKGNLPVLKEFREALVKELASAAPPHESETASAPVGA